MNKLSTNKLIVLCGPTASGKTSLGVSIAERFGGEILSIDSRQVYKGMDIGTGKDLIEYKNIPYHLIDIADPSESYTLYHFIDDFYAAYRKIEARKNLPVAVGGTGLYLEAVLKQYRIPNVPENRELRKELKQEEKEVLKNRLNELNSRLYSETDLSSKMRIIRSIEIALYSKDHEVIFAGENPPQIIPLLFATAWPRKELVERIDLRLNDRIKEGMIEEVEELLKKGVAPEKLILFGMEYKYITEYITNKINYTTMIRSLSTAIHRLAKRQMTWFRGMERRGFTIHWIRKGESAAAFEQIEQFLE
ncbi:MAG: tRNA (adenosine(37)-N6)-dimethylallyltransferase MiaA [bacterium]|nr:tRNA (adenosine(37)-N6)-dimethylallyltransferase MiaA [bacterium]